MSTKRTVEMKADLLVAEIGSTTTVVSALGLEPPALLGQGFAATLQPGGDVTAALERALENLAAGLGGRDLDWSEFMAASSAAGGLSMSVHGLVYAMTVKAAREAALGAGAVLKMITAGKMTAADMEQLRRIKPKMILLAGGVDYGEKETALHNARLIAGLGLPAPVVYAGNVAARAELAALFKAAGVKAYFVDNVYPRVDELIVEPARKVIQEAFEEHIVTAPGMERIRSMVGGPILPTPGAVMEACKLLHPLLGDLCAVDVGGATTDVHSAARGSPEIQAILEGPEPMAKRTVEGDLGIHVHAGNIAALLGDCLETELGFDPAPLLKKLRVIPESGPEIALVQRLRDAACGMAFARHAGRIRHLYGPTGRITVASGKDLTAVRTIIGTGGPLTRLPGGREALAALIGQGRGRELYPQAAQIAIDSRYIMATCGVLARRYPEAALSLLLDSLELKS